MGVVINIQHTLGSFVTLGILKAANVVALALVVLKVLAFLGDRRVGKHLEQTREYTELCIALVRLGPLREDAILSV